MAKMTKNTAAKRLDEARSKVLLVMRECTDLTPAEATALFKLSNDIFRMRTKVKRG
jgi:hypothetical protein